MFDFGSSGRPHSSVCKNQEQKEAAGSAASPSTDLHAVGEHDADGHELGEDPEELRVGQHTVLQAVVQEAGVVAQHVVDVGRLQSKEGQRRKAETRTFVRR